MPSPRRRRPVEQAALPFGNGGGRGKVRRRRLAPAPFLAALRPPPVPKIRAAPPARRRGKVRRREAGPVEVPVCRYCGHELPRLKSGRWAKCRRLACAKRPERIAYQRKAALA
jgi:hypothetical protein